MIAYLDSRPRCALRDLEDHQVAPTLRHVDPQGEIIDLGRTKLNGQFASELTFASAEEVSPGVVGGHNPQRAVALLQVRNLFVGDFSFENPAAGRVLAPEVPPWR